MDPAFLVLLIGASVAAIQAVRSLLSSSVGVGAKPLISFTELRVERGRIVGRGRCYAGVVIEELRCVYEAGDLFESIVERILSQDRVVGLVVGKRLVDRSRLLRDIENRIMSLRVVLEREPGNKFVERRLKLLERMYEMLLSGQPILVSSLLLVVGDRCESVDSVAEEVAKEVSKTGCRAVVVKGVKLLDALGLALGVREKGIDAVAPAKPLAKIIVDTLEAGRSFTLKGVYLGRSRRGSPFMLPLAGRQGSLHYVVVGPTGRGKTTLASILLLRADALGFKVHGVDPKGDMVAKLRGLLDSYEVSVRDAVQAAFWLFREGVVNRKVLEELLVELGLEASLSTSGFMSESCLLDDMVRGDFRLSRLGLRGLNICSKPAWVRPGTVYDVSMLPEALRTVAIVTIAYLALHVGGSLLVIDEAWRLGKMASFHLVRLYKEARSRGLSLVAVTQDPRDLPDEVYNNSYGVLIFGSSDERYVETVVARLGLGSYEKRLLRVIGVGEVLVKLSSQHPEIVEVDAAELLGR